MGAGLLLVRMHGNRYNSHTIDYYTLFGGHLIYPPGSKFHNCRLVGGCLEIRICMFVITGRDDTFIAL